MSRIGRMPIPVPANVRVQQEGTTITISGPRGTLTRDFRPEMMVKLVDDTLVVERPNDARQNRALHGLTRALLANMVHGVTEGFRRELVINGVGFRATQQGKNLELLVGFSHPVVVEPPEGITLEVDRTGRFITITGSDKEMVGEVAAKMRAIRKPEPYKGKGIAYNDEVIRRKAGKAGRVGGV